MFAGKCKTFRITLFCWRDQTFLIHPRTIVVFWLSGRIWERLCLQRPYTRHGWMAPGKEQLVWGVILSFTFRYPGRHSHLNPPGLFMQVWEQEPGIAHSSMSESLRKENMIFMKQTKQTNLCTSHLHPSDIPLYTDTCVLLGDPHTPSNIHLIIHHTTTLYTFFFYK